MRLLKRNLRPITVREFSEELIPIVDEDGYETGEYERSKDIEYELKVNISRPSGYIARELLGNLEDYDYVIITDQPIDKRSTIFFNGEKLFIKRINDSLNVHALGVSKSANNE